VFSLRNQPILDENEIILHEVTPTNFSGMRDGVVMDQLIPFHKSNKKVSEQMMDHPIPQTTHCKFSVHKGAE